MPRKNHRFFPVRAADNAKMRETENARDKLTIRFLFFSATLVDLSADVVRPVSLSEATPLFNC